MTYIAANGLLVICKEEPQICELCGDFAETRPYGPKGENICFECGKKDIAAAKRAFIQRLNSN